MIQTYTHPELATSWLHRHIGRTALYTCILGFTETGLVPGISAAGATPADREYTAMSSSTTVSNPNPRFRCLPSPPEPPRRSFLVP